MANIFLAWQNRADEGTLSGGNWLTTLPLSNLQNRQVQKVARSNGVTAAATQFDLDLLNNSKLIGVVALVVHNISVSGKVRIRSANATSGFTNLLAQQDAFDNAAWTKTSVTVSADGTPAPDGTTTADALTANAANSSVAQSVAIAGSTAFEASIYLRANSNVTVNIRTVESPSNTVTTTVCNVTTAWQRFTVSGTTQSGTTSISFGIGGDSSFSTGTTVIAWRGQVASGVSATFDSGWTDVWPSGVVPQELLEWEDDNFWLATLSSQARAGFQSPFIYRLQQAVSYRYWRIEVLDTTNSDGHVQIGRLFMARGWQPTINFSYGAGLRYEDPTPVDVSLSGAEYFDQRSKFRVFGFQFEYLSETDAYAYALELQRLAGISGEVLVIPDTDLGGQQPLRSFVGRLRQIGAVTQPYPSTYSVAFEVKELL